MRQEARSVSILLTLAPVGLLVMMLTLPPITAETIPKDVQLGVVELFSALPLQPGVYLAGKVLGVWANLLLVLTGVAFSAWLVCQLIFGPLDPAAYLRICLVGIVPVSLFVSGISILLASRQPTRRRATIVGGILTLYHFVMLPTFTSSQYGWMEAFSPGAWLLLVFGSLQDYIASTGAIVALSNPPLLFVWRTMAAVLAQLVLVWLGVWLWWQKGSGEERLG